ncbi:uncharacterized protein LOC111621564 [Centruroides sculpturatus]|uniref:uncharacterized protein LOC111621564 n=1 Tax=Centruroides sculpturatus TaxID=218467 RepID=UPI000C6E81E0|nr:uncharacterized protein LOC111621564 [Centruroides sculpturatus]
MAVNPKRKSYSPSFREAETSSKKKSLKSREEEEFAYLLEGEDFNLEEGIRVLLRLHLSMNSKVDQLISRIDYVSEWLKNLDEGLADLDIRLETLEKLADKNCGLSDQSNVTKKFNDITRELDFLDNQRRINNVVISGLEEVRDESSLETKEKIIEFASRVLQMPDIKIGRAMRVGKKKANSPRLIICTFVDYYEKMYFKKRVLELKPDGVYVNDDFSPRVKNIRFKLRDFGRQSKLSGARMVKIVYDKIIIDGTKYFYDVDCDQVKPVSS